jgi:uncharacterized iron-regulated protein
MLPRLEGMGSKRCFDWARRGALCGLTLAALTGCAIHRDPQTPYTQRDLNAMTSRSGHRFLLLGEIHDATAQHRQRLQWLSQLARAAPQRPIALAFEQLDANRQQDVDRFVAALTERERLHPDTARRLAEAAGFNHEGWDWTLYEPALQLALRARWLIVAANLSSAITMAIARGASDDLLHQIPLANSARDWTPSDDEALAAQLQSGHCNALAAQRIPAMARAQRARDAQLALSMSSALGQLQKASPATSLVSSARETALVILLAGNGHVRKDFGVPRYLAALHPQEVSMSVAMLEEPEAGSGLYDDWVLTPVQARPDPCLTFRKP